MSYTYNIHLNGRFLGRVSSAVSDQTPAKARAAAQAAVESHYGPGAVLTFHSARPA